MSELKQQVETLEVEVKRFIEGLPYWSRFIAKKTLSGDTITDEIIDTTISFLLEELKIKTRTEKNEIDINDKLGNFNDYKTDLRFAKLENIEGVNALTENQKIEFNPNLTLIYGANGSGKSGYVRLFKNVFHSKYPENILPNVHLDSGQKPINAEFTFASDGADFTLEYSKKDNSVFEQFAVFDGKSLYRQLAEKNELEFRPAGLDFFSKYTEAILKVEQKFNTEIQNKKTGNTAMDLSDLFDGESEIKVLIKNLSYQTKVEDLNKYAPFSEEDKVEKLKIKERYDELYLASKNKEKQIINLKNIKKLLTENKVIIEKNNQYFATDYLIEVKNAIANLNNKKLIVKAEGIENFKTDKIEGVGTDEWKKLIIAARSFSKKQTNEVTENCLLCQQPLSDNAQKLIDNYWIFIKSIAEKNAKRAQEELDRIKEIYKEINFDLLPESNVLTVWLAENHPKTLKELRKKLSKQKILSDNILSDIQNKRSNVREGIENNVYEHTFILKDVNEKIKNFQEDKQIKELDKLLKTKIFLEHKEKFNIHFSKFETYICNQAWIEKANKADYAKRRITAVEKSLSDKYFNQKYIDIFNKECEKLDAKFGIEINYTGTAGKSYRQLKLKGKSPNAILSEGEQKVIAIADFLAEMQLSQINRGIIFDDPVTSLDERRKSKIAKRLVQESRKKQTIIYTHDLVFVSSLIGYCSDFNNNYCCHWIENHNGNIGQVWLNNSPSYEKEYRNAEPAKKLYSKAKKDDCSPMQREFNLKSGFAALRTCYEVLVINDLFKNVVQRFNERVSVDSLKNVYFDKILIEELQESFGQCCRYMEGHTHSDKFAYRKPDINNLDEEIKRYESIRKKIKQAGK